MCPDQQLLSTYFDKEISSEFPEYIEKMERHLEECPECRQKFENYKKIQESLKKDSQNEQELIQKAKENVMRNLVSVSRPSHVFATGNRTSSNIWQRKLSIPLPAVAAAALVIIFFAAVWMRSGTPNNNMYANNIAEPANFVLAADDDMSGILPIADMNGVLQYLGSNDTNIIILQLPETRNFSRSGEPAIIRAADYPRR